jgi:hypothetical protein
MRFVARRGRPANIFSDNGTNFVGANNELKSCVSELDQNHINDSLLSRGIQWHFQPPSASHRGGVWERIIRSCRRLLNVLCNEQVLTDETLSTFMVEVERILNNRPIVSVSSDSRDIETLTPNHLIMLKTNSGIDIADGFAICYRKCYHQANYLAGIFWHRWLREYVPTLQLRQKWLEPNRNLQPGDLVMIVSESMPRGKWPLGLIIEAHQSEDGYVRSVTIKTSLGQVLRDVRKVCLLEGNFE